MNLNSQRIGRFAGVLIAFAAALGHAQADQWGGLKGRFVFDGPIPNPKAIAGLPGNCGNVVDEDLIADPNGGLANVMVFVNGNVAVHPDYEKSKSDTVILETKGCRFEPHVVGVRVGQTLMLKNSDGVADEPSLTGRRMNVNPLLRAGESFRVAVDGPEWAPVPVESNIHAWMSARLLVRPNPYFAISNRNGTFEIKKLPAGDLEFTVYHERARYIREAEIHGNKVEWPRGRMKVAVKAGDESTDLGDIKLPAKLFK